MHWSKDYYPLCLRTWTRRHTTVSPSGGKTTEATRGGTHTRPRLLHGDLWCENILLSPDLSHMVGVVDFEQIRIGDPVSEFAALRYVGDEFVDRVRSQLPRDR